MKSPSKSVAATAVFKQSTEGSIVARDLSGRMLMQQRFTGKTLSTIIDLEAFTPGVYFISIETNKGNLVRKLVVME